MGPGRYLHLSCFLQAGLSHTGLASPEPPRVGLAPPSGGLGCCCLIPAMLGEESLLTERQADADFNNPLGPFAAEHLVYEKFNVVINHANVCTLQNPWDHAK